MTKADLVDEVVRVSKLSKKHAEIIVNTVFGSIIEALQRDDKIELRGFGSFRVRRRRSRQGRNPKTGDRVEVPSKRVPYFKPGKELKELINREPDAQTAAAQSPSPTPAFPATDTAVLRPSTLDADPCILCPCIASGLRGDWRT